MLFIISLLLFWLLNSVPGNAAIFRIGLQSGNCVACRENLEADLGLDRPFFVQYFDWASHAARLDFGKTLTDRKEIAPKIQERIGNTVEIGVLTILLTILMGVPIGIISAVKSGAMVDYVLRFTSILGLSVPNFWIATILITLPVIWWDLSPLKLDYVTFTENPLGNLRIVIWPALVLAIPAAAYVARFTRSGMLEALLSDHVRTARSKGLHERAVVMRHVFRASMITLLTLIGIQAGAILGGAVIAEQIFGIPGLGTLTLTAVQQQDYRTVLATTMIFATWFIVITLIVDILYAYVDPRIRY